MNWSVVSVEAFDDLNWKCVWTNVGEKETLLEEAEAIEKAWLDAGWPKEKIRVRTDSFRKIIKDDF